MGDSLAGSVTGTGAGMCGGARCTMHPFSSCCKVPRAQDICVGMQLMGAKFGWQLQWSLGECRFRVELPIKNGHFAQKGAHVRVMGLHITSVSSSSICTWRLWRTRCADSLLAMRLRAGTTVMHTAHASHGCVLCWLLCQQTCCTQQQIVHVLFCTVGSDPQWPHITEPIKLG